MPSICRQPAESPIADVALEAAAARVAGLLRLGGHRVPRDLRREGRALLADVYGAVGTEAAPGVRLALARRAEAVEDTLRGRPPAFGRFYAGGRLGILRTWWPIRIVGIIDSRRIGEHFQRYEGRAERAEARLRWFLRRCGVGIEAPRKRAPWELPYAGHEEHHELIWGHVSRR